MSHCQEEIQALADALIRRYPHLLGLRHNDGSRNAAKPSAESSSENCMLVRESDGATNMSLNFDTGSPVVAITPSDGKHGQKGK